jgi:hypothetical protein
MMRGQKSKYRAGAALPETLLRHVDAVIAQSGLEGEARRDVRDELIAHCEDGLAAGRSPEEVLAAFGDVTEAAHLIALERTRGGGRRMPMRLFGASVAMCG